MITEESGKQALVPGVRFYFCVWRGKIKYDIV